MANEREIDQYLREYKEKLEDLLHQYIDAKRIALMKGDEESQRQALDLLRQDLWLLAKGEGMELPKGWRIAD